MASDVPLYALSRSQKQTFQIEVLLFFLPLPPSILIQPSFLLALYSSLADLIHKASDISSIPIIFRSAHLPGTYLWSSSLHFQLPPHSSSKSNWQNRSQHSLPESCLIRVYYSQLRASLFSPVLSAKKFRLRVYPFLRVRLSPSPAT